MKRMCYDMSMDGGLPRYFRQILWSYDVSKIDTKKGRRLIVVNTINYGSWRHWTWIAENYGKQTVREIVESVPASEFRPGALRLASLIFSVRKQLYASRSDYIREQKNL